MESSRALQLNSKQCFCKFSPDGTFFAAVNLCHLTVYSTKKAALVHQYNHPNLIDCFSWSPDSEFILCYSITHGLIYIFSLQHPEWRCKVEMGSIGLAYVIWAPNSRHFIAISELNLYAYVFSTAENKIVFIDKLKTANPILQFSPDGEHLAVIELITGEENILVLCATAWKTEQRLHMGLNDMKGFAWNDRSNHICAWEFPIGRRFVVYEIDGTKLAEYELNTTINYAVWSGDILYVACTDDSIVLVNGFTWTIMAKLQMVAGFQGRTSCDVFEEVQLAQCAPSLQLRSAALTSASSTHELVVSTRLQYQRVSGKAMACVKSPDDFDPEELENLIKLRRCGISHTQFSFDQMYMASCSFYNPTMVWIWHIEKLQLVAVLKHQNDVNCLEWEPGRHRLLICTSMQPSPHVFVWTPQDASAIPLPKLGTQSLINVHWHPSLSIFLANSVKCTVLYSFGTDTDVISSGTESFVTSDSSQQSSPGEDTEFTWSPVKTSSIPRLNLGLLRNSDSSQSEPSAGSSTDSELLSSTDRQDGAAKSRGVPILFVGSSTGSQSEPSAGSSTNSELPSSTDRQDGAAKSRGGPILFLGSSTGSQSEPCSSSESQLLSPTVRQDGTTQSTGGKASYVSSSTGRKQTGPSSHFWSTASSTQSEVSDTNCHVMKLNLDLLRHSSDESSHSEPAESTRRNTYTVYKPKVVHTGASSDTYVHHSKKQEVGLSKTKGQCQSSSSQGHTFSRVSSKTKSTDQTKSQLSTGQTRTMSLASSKTESTDQTKSQLSTGQTRTMSLASSKTGSTDQSKSQLSTGPTRTMSLASSKTKSTDQTKSQSSTGQTRTMSHVSSKTKSTDQSKSQSSTGQTRTMSRTSSKSTDQTKSRLSTGQTRTMSRVSGKTKSTDQTKSQLSTGQTRTMSHASSKTKSTDQTKSQLSTGQTRTMSRVSGRTKSTEQSKSQSSTGHTPTMSHASSKTKSTDQTKSQSSTGQTRTMSHVSSKTKSTDQTKSQSSMGQTRTMSHVSSKTKSDHAQGQASREIKSGSKCKLLSDPVKHEIDFTLELHVDFRRRPDSGSSDDSCPTDSKSALPTTANTSTVSKSSHSELPSSKTESQSKSTGAIRKTSKPQDTTNKQSAASGASSTTYWPCTTDTLSRGAKSFLTSSFDSEQSASSGKNRSRGLSDNISDSMWCESAGRTQSTASAQDISSRASRTGGTLQEHRVVTQEHRVATQEPTLKPVETPVPLENQQFTCGVLLGQPIGRSSGEIQASCIQERLMRAQVPTSRPDVFAIAGYSGFNLRQHRTATHVPTLDLSSLDSYSSGNLQQHRTATQVPTLTTGATSLDNYTSGGTLRHPIWSKPSTKFQQYTSTEISQTSTFDFYTRGVTSHTVSKSDFSFGTLPKPSNPIAEANSDLYSLGSQSLQKTESDNITHKALTSETDDSLASRSLPKQASSVTTKSLSSDTDYSLASRSLPKQASSVTTKSLSSDTDYSLASRSLPKQASSIATKSQSSETDDSLASRSLPKQASSVTTKSQSSETDVSLASQRQLGKWRIATTGNTSSNEGLHSLDRSQLGHSTGRTRYQPSNEGLYSLPSNSQKGKSTERTMKSLFSSLDSLSYADSKTEDSDESS